MDILKTLSGTSPVVLFAMSLVLFTAFLVLISGTVNSAAQKLLQRFPGGKKAAAARITADSPTMQAVGKLSDSVLGISTIFPPLVAELKRTNDNFENSLVLYAQRHIEVMAQFNLNEVAMKTRHDQIEQLTIKFTNAIDMMSSVASGLARNNETVNALTLAQEKSFAIREKANRDISEQMQAIALSLQGVNRTVGVVGTTMVDMGGSLEDVNLLLKSLTDKIDRMQASMARMEGEIKALKADIDSLISSSPVAVKSMSIIVDPAPPVTMQDQTEIKTATLSPTEPLKPKESPGEQIHTQGTFSPKGTLIPA